jgi:A/G-specific adenine glycosylase
MDPLRNWFLEEKRDLPWRREPTPYRVWVSEVMLQQTQVAVVIPYFERWMKKFPNIETLAHAPLEEVMKMWEGLGYYSRARHLHEGAKIVLSEYGGVLPSEREKLMKIKGFGPYTVGAVLSFAFHQKAAAVDGNVVRVLARFFALEVDASKKRQYEEVALSILPLQEPWIVMEGLIELGAQVCQKMPKCSLCPLQAECLGFSRGIAPELPRKKAKEAAILLFREVAIVTDGAAVLVRQEKVGKVMGGLYEFPYIEKGEEWKFNFTAKERQSLPIVKHGFTKYRATLYPTLWKVEAQTPVEGFEWIAWEKIAGLPFSSGHRRILRRLNEDFTY